MFDREQDREALAELRKAVYLSPYEAQAHLLIGRIHLRGGRPADAVDAFKISIWSEDHAPAHVSLAEAYLKLGDTANARAEVAARAGARPVVGRRQAAAVGDRNCQSFTRGAEYAEPMG